MSEEIKNLINGNKEFKRNYFDSNKSLFNDLVLYGQKPKNLVVACSDSRVDPAMILNAQPGQLFVIRNVANLIPPFENNDASYHGTSAALQFGVCFLEVENLILFGHTQCGGIRTLLENADDFLDKNAHGFIAKWMGLARPAYEKVLVQHSQMSLEDRITTCERYTLINSLNNLHTFPWITERVNSGKLFLHVWYFDLATGTIHMYDQQKNVWGYL